MTLSKSRTAIAVSMLFGAVLSACGSSSSDDASKPNAGGTLADYNTLAAGAPDTLDPNISALSSTSAIDALLFNGLTAPDADGEVQKQVASDYSSSDNATVWNFTLRDDVKFSDGSPVLPSSFKRSWERALDPALKSDVSFRVQQIASSSEATKLDNVTVDDQKRTLKIKLPNPESNLPAVLTAIVFSPIPESVPNDGTWGSSLMIGNGPFKLSAPFKAGETLKLVRNENYAGSGEKKLEPYLDAIEMHSFEDVDSAYREFAAGKGDLSVFPESAAADLQKYKKDDVIIKQLLGVEAFGFNMKSTVFGGDANLKLRQAIDSAIDKAQINEDAFGGTHAVASQFSPSVIHGAQPKPTDGKANLDRTKQLLREWGKTAPQVKLSYQDSLDPKLVNVAVANLIAAGIPAVADPQPADDFYGNVTDGKYDVFLFQWTADNPSYQAMLQPIFASDSSSNISGYSNSEVDDLFTKAGKTSSVDESDAYYRKAEQIILDEQAYVPIDWTTTNIIKNSYVHDVVVDPIGDIDYLKVWLSEKPTA